MALNYPGGYITKSPPTPTSTSAPGIWTMDQAMQYIKAGTWPTPPIGDPYWQYTALLSGTGSTNGAQNNTFIDSSTNNFTLTRNGNATQGTFTPFSAPSGYWGNYFPGGGVYLSLPNNSNLAWGSGTFTFEFWFYNMADSTNQAIYDTRQTGLNPANEVFILLTTGNEIRLSENNTARLESTGSAAAPNKWVHIAIERNSSNVITLYVNGVSNATWSSTNTFVLGNPPRIGRTVNDSISYNGYISNMRLVKGSVVYNGAFTPPTSPLTAITNTQLLTCQSNRFIDNSSNSFSVTVTGTPSVQAFSPFGNTELYNTTSVGGSGYFDADADYVQTSTTSSDFQFTGDFTIEGWFYPNGTALDAQPFGQNYVGGGVQLYVNANGSIEVAYNVASQFTTSAGAVVKGQWNHIALTRSGTTVRCMVNGVSVGSTTTSGTIGATTAFAIGARSGGGYVCDGYVSSVRVVNGTAVYTGSTYTIPTAPVTAIANTKLLCNFTNAGIYDQAAENNFETVGNAQVSTSVVKYGNGSMYFDGVGDRLYRFNSPLYNFGTGDFTVECWVYIAANTSYATLIDFSNDGGGGVGWFLEYSSTRGVYWYMGTGAGNSNVSAELTPPLTTWTHIAVTRSNGYAKIFINGGQVAGGVLTSSSVSTNPLVIGSSKNGTYPLNGYLSDVRITKGLARYTYNFTPPTRAFGAFFQAQAVPAADPYFDYTTLLLPGTGTNGAQNNTFLDSSTNAFSITRNGNTTQGTFSPFSQTGWSNYFDGSGDYLTIPNNTALQFGSGDFTIEAWVYPTVAAFGDIFSKGDYGGGATAGYFEFRLSNTNAVTFYSNNTGTALTTSATVPLSNWSHVAVSRSGTTIRIFVNGVLSASGTDSTTYSNTGLSAIGSASQTSYTNFFNGYISNLRVVKGTAVYTANFTPSTTALTAISGTSLLTCQNNRFIDNSTNAFTLTANGNVAVQAYSPFAPTAAYSAATNGGSGYFDGTGDYLQVANNAALQFGTGDFTVECWCYVNNSLSTTTTLFSVGRYDAGILLRIAGGSSDELYINGTNYAVPFSTYMQPYAWAHIAVTRSGSTVRVFVNGSVALSTTDSSNISQSTATTIGAATHDTTQDMNGYIAGFRILKGTAQYTAAFTPPTSPPTNITNTSLLCNFTNAGITDATAKNDLETVADAQISNTTAKWGSTSIKFDGTGDYLVAPSSAITSLEGDFTVEFWVYRVAGNNFFFTLGDSFTSTGFDIYIGTAGTVLNFFSNNAARITATPFAATTWSHLAVARYGSTVTMYINGASVGTWSSSATFSGRVFVGAEFYGGSVTGVCNGYMQDVRITKGIARYTQNFTPPTAAFQLL